MKTLLSILILLVFTIPLSAHPAPFSYLDVRIIAPSSSSAAELTGKLVIHAPDAAYELKLANPEDLHDDRVVTRHAADLARILAGRLEFLADGDALSWTMTGARALPGLDSVELTWRAPAPRVPGKLTVSTLLFPYDPNHQTFVNIFERDELARQEVLNRERTRVDFFTGTRQGKVAVLRSFIESGIHHIAIGPDHILFVVGLLLLGGSIPRLLAIVSAFTVGHSVTLALATLNILQPPASIVEPAIALSIVYVGADNLLIGHRGRDVRPWIALAFGLVHGFGFASVLRETGLPDGALGLSLFAFNVGVEIGQAAIVIVVASALAVIRKKNAIAAHRLATVGSVIVMIAGAFWFFERVY